MRRGALIALGLGGLTFAIVAVVVGTQGDPAPTATEAAPAAPATEPPSCRFTRGQDFAFDVRIDTDLTLHPAAVSAQDDAPPEVVHASTTSRLAARVLAVTSAGEAILALRPTSWEDLPAELAAAEAAPADLQRAYLARIDTRCHLLATARHREASVLAYDRVLRVLDLLDLPLPTSPQPTAYETRHADTYGTFVVSNRWTPASTPPTSDRGTIQRRRTRYLETRATDQPDLTVTISESTGRLTLGPGPWFAALTQSDTLGAKHGGKTALTSTTRASLTAHAPDPRAFVGQDLSLASYVWGRPDPAALRAARDPLVTDAASADEAWAAYQTLADADWFGAQKRLRAWLRAHPEGAAQLAAQLRAGRFSEREAAALCLALAKSGSREAQRALEQLAADASLPENLRTQAATALADLVAPDAHAVETLIHLADRDGGASQQDLVGSAATMSLGTLLGQHSDVAEVADAARSYLEGRLGATDPKGVSEALWAVGNSGDASFLDLLTPLIENADAELRAAAAHALRKMPGQEAGPLLAAHLKTETHPEVATELAASRREQIANGAQLDDTELQLLRSKLIQAPEPLRREIVLALGAASRHQPAARDVLVAWYPNETSLAVKQLIGQFVPARLL